MAGAARPGFPPVPPPAPSADRVTARPSLPVTPAPERDLRPAEPSPVRHSTPIPPLPGLRPSARDSAGSRRPKAPRPPASPGRRRLFRAVLVLVLLVAVVALYHLGLYFYVDRSMDRVHALATNGPEVLAPQLQAGTHNYLIVGTGVPGQTGPASVATLLVSVSADNQRAVLVSVPPTALVQTPECRTASGGLRAPTSEAFANSLLKGGPSCTVRALQQISGLRIDHYLGVDLARLPGMVDALGGVPMCVVPSPALSAATRPLPAGRSQLSGEAATFYLRPADAASDVNGAAVAERAQLLLTSTLRAAMSRKTLTDTVTLTRFLSRAAGALTVDEGTTLGDLRTLGGSLGRLTGGAVQRASLPVSHPAYTPVGSHDSYVLLDRGATRSLFDSVIDRDRLPPDLPPSGAAPQAATGGSDAVPTAPPQPSPAAPQGPTVPPNQVALDVLNGTGTSGLAGTVADSLRAQGFTVGSVGNATGAVPQTLVRYGPGEAEQARTVAAAVPGSVLQAADSLGAKVQLVIGPGYSTVLPVQLAVAPPAAGSAAPPSPPAPPPVTC
jgi:LCP family protein required for cell wall assembly